MVRWALPIAFVILLGGEAPPPDVIQHYVGGRSSISPDGKWTVWSPMTSEEKVYATAWLKGPGVRRRRLFDFERMIEVKWPEHGRFVVITDIVINSMAIKIFALGPHQKVRPDAVERDIERQMQRLRPDIQSIGIQHIEFGRSRTSLCVRVTQMGLPPGRREGSYVERQASFRLDLDHSSVTRIQNCPGARRE